MSRRKMYILAALIAGVLSAIGLYLGGQPTAASDTTQAGKDWKTDILKYTANLQPTVTTAVRFDVSPPLREMAKDVKPIVGPISEQPELGPVDFKQTKGFEPDGALQTMLGPLAIPTPIISFDGISNLCGCSPPDSDGDIGPNHYIQMINLHYQIFDRSGVSVLGPFPNNTLWAGFGGACQTQNAGDPIILHDQMADRWLLTQFTASAVGGLYYNCVALSQTSDPTGSYYRWAFSNGNNFGDYPKYGVWPDAYYINTRDFLNGSVQNGVTNYALDRAQMLAGNPAPTVISFGLRPPAVPTYIWGDGLLPSDFDGSMLPPVGSPNFFVGTMDDGHAYGGPSDAINFFEFHADFVVPANSTFMQTATLPTLPFDSQPAFCSGRNCVPQPSTANRLDHLGYRQRPTFRLAYRNMGTYESLVTNQSVEASPTMSGIRWYELRSPDNTPIIFQQGTYAPGITDGIHRWMGSIAMDAVGNIGLGYSASSATLFPSIRYTGRLATDPLGTLPQGEASIHEGTGSQTASQRWGDYSSLTVDPVDDCTLWYTNEYLPTTSGVGWRNRTGAFKFPGCVAGGATSTPTTTGTPPTATLTRTATITPIATATPCAAGNYTYTTGTGQITPGTVDTGNHCDDCNTSITLPFPFTLYGVSYTAAAVGSNGFVSFGTPNDTFVTTCLPAATFTNTIFPFWTDQITATEAGKGIYTSVTGTAPNRQFHIEFRACLYNGPTTCLPNSDSNYEVRLFETTNTFSLIYGVMGSANSTEGAIGVQQNSTASTQVSCNVGAPTGTAYNFTYQGGGCATGTPATATTTATGITTATATGTATRTATGIATGTSTAIATSTRTGTTVPPTVTRTSTISPPTLTATTAPPTATVGCTPFNAQVNIESFSFQPQNITISVGSTVQWTNLDQVAHDTYSAGNWASPLLNQGESFSFTFNTTGTYSYICTPHPFMTGTITVIGGCTPTVTNTPVPVPTSCTLLFSDVPSTNTFYPFVRCLVCRGIISGYADGTFRPNNQVTRGQLSKIVSNSAGYNEPITGQTFQDVPSTNTFYVWIERLTRRGHMSGYMCGGPGEPCINNMPYFRPFANATRGQISKIVSNAAGFSETHTTQTFQDVPTSNVFYQFIERLVARGVITGYECGGPGEPCINNRPYFRPNTNATRAQVAKIVASTFYPNCQTP